MNFKSLFLPACLALAVSAFAAEPPPVPATLDALLKVLATPAGEGSPGEDALQSLAAAASKPGAGSARAAFAQTLCATASNAKLSFYVRSLVLRQLAVVGGAESVETLTGLMSDSDPQIRECARQTLERNPDAKAGNALRAALEKGGDVRWEIGLLNSLGMRRDEAAVSIISPRITKPGTALAARAALGKIATPAAVAILEKDFPASAEALAEAAHRLAQKGENAKAASLAAKVYAANVPVRLCAAALGTLAATGPEQAKGAIPSALASDDSVLQAAAVSAAFQVYGARGACETLHPKVAGMKTGARLAFLRLADPSAEADALALLTDPNPDIQAGAATALGRIGSAASVPALLKLAGLPGTPVGAALSVINGPGAAEAIRKVAADKKEDPKVRALVITVIGWRADKAAAPELVSYAAEADPAISRAACTALKSVGSDAELMPMLGLVIGGKVVNAASAVRGIAARSSARRQCVPKILAIGSGAKGAALVPMLDALSLVGGSDALQSVVGYTKASEPEVVEGAVRALCRWPELDAVAPLLTIGGDSKFPEPLRITALRSIERIVLSALDDSPQSRVDAALGLWKTATRDEEKGLALSTIAAIPNRVAATAMLPLITDARLKSVACVASLNLADALLGKSDRGSAKKLAAAVVKAQPEEAAAKRANGILTRIEIMEKNR